MFMKSDILKTSECAAAGRISLITIVLLSAIVLTAYEAPTASAECGEPNIYIQADPNVPCWLDEEPAPPCWELLEPNEPNMPLTLGKKFPVSIGSGNSRAFCIPNDHNEGKIKSVMIDVYGTNLENLECKSAWALNAKKNTMKTNKCEIGIEGISEFGDGTTIYSVKLIIEPQPAYEGIRLKNKGGGKVTITKIEGHSFCYEVNGIDVEYGIAKAQIGIPGECLAINDILIFHDSEPVNQLAEPELMVYDGGASSWTQQYVTEDPFHDVNLPQGGWRWSLSSGSGIDNDTLFDIRITMNSCRPGGYYWFYAYDSLSEGWKDFLLPSAPGALAGEPDARSPARSEDINGDCTVNLFDLAELAGQWLQ